MKPLGRKPMHRNFVDNHPPKVFINWWEVEIGTLENKSAEKRNSNKEIEEQKQEYEQERISE